MSLDFILKVAGIGLVVAILAMVLDEAGKKEQAQLLTIAGVVVVLTMVMQKIDELFTVVRTVFKLF
jgi:stage III sporulation protein AC